MWKYGIGETPPEKGNINGFEKEKDKQLKQNVAE